MKSRLVVGKRIIKVEQHRFWNRDTHQWAVHFGCIYLEDGTEIILDALPSEHDYYVKAMVWKNGKCLK